MGHEEEGQGREFEFSSSSRCLGSFFLKSGGEQFVNSSRTGPEYSHNQFENSFTVGHGEKEKRTNSS